MKKELREKSCFAPPLENWIKILIAQLGGGEVLRRLNHPLWKGQERW